MTRLSKRAVRLLQAGIRSTQKWSWRGYLLLGICFVPLLIVPRLQESLSVQDQLEPHLQSYKELEQLKEVFPYANPLWLQISPRAEVFTHGELCEAISLLDQIVLTHPEIKEYNHAFNLKKISYRGLPHLKLSSPNPCLENPESPLSSFDFLKDSPWENVFRPEISKPVFFVALGTESSGEEILDLIERLTLRIRKDFGPRALLVGSAVQDYHHWKALDRGKILNLLSLVLVILLMRGIFGTWKAGLIYSFFLTLTMGFVYGGMALLDHKIDPLSISLFLIVNLACLEDFIFVSMAQISHSQSRWRFFSKFALPCFWTSLTTMIGFGSLMISDIGSIQRFGFWACLGSFIEWLLIFFLWPFLHKKHLFFRNWINPQKILPFFQINKILSWTPPKLATLTLLSLFLWPILEADSLVLSQTPTEIFPKEHVYQKAWDKFQQERPWSAEASVIFEFKTPENLKKQVMEFLQSSPLVFQVLHWNPIESYLLAEIKDPLVLETSRHFLKTSEWGQNFISSSGEQRLQVFLKSSDTKSLNDLRGQLAEICQGTGNTFCFISSESIAYADYSQKLIWTLFESLGLCLILVSLVIFFLCRSLGSPHFWPLLISSLWSPAVVLGLIASLEIPLNLITCIVLSTLIGLTGDNAIQYLFSDPKNLHRGVAQRGGGSVSSFVMMSLGSLILLASPFAPVQTLGWIMALGFLLALFGDLWLLKGLLLAKVCSK